MARAIPVLPLVGSRMMVSGVIRSAVSAASIMATPIRSFTLPIGLKDSTLASTVASRPFVTRFSRTSGVLPMVLVILSWIFIGNLSQEFRDSVSGVRWLFSGMGLLPENNSQLLIAGRKYIGWFSGRLAVIPRSCRSRIPLARLAAANHRF